MGLISKFISNLSIMICLAVFVNSAGKSKLKLKLNALDNLFRSEMYLVNEKLDISRKEREKLLEKFEETMGYLGDRGKTKSKKLPDSTLDEEQGKRIAILSNDIKKLRDNAERSTKDTGELSDSLIRLRWGVLEEKVARKSVTDTVIQQFEEVQKNQNVTIKNREEFVTNINRLISNQNDYQDEMKKSLNEIVNIINSVLSNQTDIFNKLDEIFTIQGDLINKVNGMASQDSVGKLEVNLETAQEDNKATTSSPSPTTPGPPGSAPRNVLARPHNPQTIIIEWDEPEIPNGAIQGYKVFYTTNPTNPIVFWEIQDVSTYSRMTTITGLIPNYIYTICVLAYSATGQGPLSEPIHVVTRTGGCSSRTSFQCSGDGSCIPSAWVCDGMEDCERGDDEWNCESTTEATELLRKN